MNGVIALIPAVRQLHIVNVVSYVSHTLRLKRLENGNSLR